MIKALLFDFDGVILESAEIKTLAFRDLFLEIFPDHIDEIVEYHKTHMGVSRFVKFEYFYKQYGGRKIGEDEKEKLANKFESLVVDQVKKAPFVKGALEFLKSHEGAIPMFIVSGTPHDELVAIIETRGIKRFFEGVFGSPQSKEDIINSILKRYGWKPKEVVFIGDAHSDYLAAKKTDVQFIGRKCGHSSLPDDCRIKIEDLSQLKSLLNSMLNQETS